jgi:hypothetical protein
MDTFINPDTWKHLLGALVNSPYIMIPPIAIAAGLIGWWLRGIKSDGAIAGLKAQINVYEDRLKFAAEKVATANEARDDVLRQFQAYRADVEANAGHITLAATAAKLEAALDKLGAANNAVSSAIGGPLSNTPLASSAAQAEIINKWW